jgi:hypothetical protein
MLENERVGSTKGNIQSYERTLGYADMLTVSFANMSIGISFNQVLECVWNVRLKY